MIIISLDAVSDSDLDRLAALPTISRFLGEATLHRQVPTLLVSNTYPIHASVVTGVLPSVHGIIANTEPFPYPNPLWHTEAKKIGSPTLWQAARAKGIHTAAVFWPVTAGAKDIRYNIPEVQARPGKSQIITSLRAGSKALQLRLFLRHRHLLKGIRQPYLDDFATASMVDILKEKRPGLSLLHLTAYDALCHQYGKDSREAMAGLESLDLHVGQILGAAGEGEDVLIFSDHGQLPVTKTVDPNGLLVNMGYLHRSEDGYVKGKDGCFIECCGGSAFFHSDTLMKSQMLKVKKAIGGSEGFLRFLTEEEMAGAGYGHAAFGFAARMGFCFSAFGGDEKATHGYPPDMPDYGVFYALRGRGAEKGKEIIGGSLLDIAPLVAGCMGLTLHTGRA